MDYELLISSKHQRYQTSLLVYNVKLYAKTITLIIMSAITMRIIYNYLQETIDMELSKS